VKSDNDSFKVTVVKLTNGRSRRDAEQTASNIKFNAVQRDTTLLLDRGIAITPNEKFRNQRLIVTVAVPVGKRVFINENEGWGEGFRVHMFGSDNYWDWENSMETGSEWWRPRVEYVMTNKGLKSLDGSDEKDHDDSNDDESRNRAIEEFRKSKEQIEREKEQKLRELEEIDRELQKTDTTRYRFTPASPDTPTVERTQQTTFKNAVSNNEVPIGINDVLMIKFAL
jgi:hypothetical protein